jgi:hypothetical protein
MNIPNDLKVTTELLWRAALVFALIDVFMITFLTRLIKPKDLLKMKWRLIIVMAVFFCLLFGSIMSIIFWDSVYSYVFPSWMRWIIPPAYGILFSMAGLFFWWLAFRLPTNPVMIFCILGGSWGFLTHYFAIQRGLLEKPPMLQGASSLSALTIATFEFIFYWSICLGITFLIEYLRSGLTNRKKQ